ncbi:MAG TPA: branched-chain amino acid ABC transporter permease [Chloroflexota bacterium]|nr:branched-chain amino acid ABC transporter permease [Chloroflexota bacterium]
MADTPKELSPPVTARRWALGRPGVLPLLGLVALAALAVFPLVEPPIFYLRLLATVFLFATLAQSWNILGGYTGYVSFGHVTFFGLGAYTAALLFRELGWPPYVAAVPAGLVAGLFAVVVGYPTLRLRGPYFGIATLALSFVVQLAIANVPWTGAGEGIVVRGGLPFRRLALEQFFYYAYLALLLLTTLAVGVLERSKLGYGLQAIRDDEDAALSVGVPATRLKLLAFGLSSFFAGAAGCFYVHQASFASPPDVFTLGISIKALVYAMVGGAGTLLGPLVGAALMELVNMALTTSPLGTYGIDRIVFGALLIIVVLAAPGGIVGLARRRLPGPWRPR